MARSPGALPEDLHPTRAVFAALRDTVTDKEFSDLLAELPKGYCEALL